LQRNLCCTWYIFDYIIIDNAQGKDEKTGIGQFASFIKRMEPKSKLNLKMLLDKRRVEGFLQLWTVRMAQPSTIGNKMKALSLLYKWFDQEAAIVKKLESNIAALKRYVDDIRQDYRKLNASKRNTAQRDEDLLEEGCWLTVGFI